MFRVYAGECSSSHEHQQMAQLIVVECYVTTAVHDHSATVDGTQV